MVENTAGSGRSRERARPTKTLRPMHGRRSYAGTGSCFTADLFGLDLDTQVIMFPEAGGARVRINIIGI